MKLKKRLLMNCKLALSSFAMVPIVTLASYPLLMTVVGQNFMGTQPPLLVTLSNNSSHWIVRAIPELPNQGRFLAASCTGNGNAAMCAAVGQNFNDKSPLLVTSINGGNDWVMTPVPGMPPGSFFNNVSCTGSGRTATCVITGHNARMNMPLLVTSTDGGSSWGIPTIQAGLTGYFFNSTSCTGSGSTAICIIGGAYQDDTRPPILITSTDGGHRFAVQVISDLPLEGFLMGTSCTGEGATAICAAVGRDKTHHQPLLIASADASKHWVVKTTSNFPTAGFLMSTSCTGEGSTAVCIAGGKDTTHHRPLLVVSSDGGDHWVLKTIPGVSADGIFNSTNCTGNSMTAICIAAGENLVTYAPLLVVSLDGGNNWKIQTIPEIPTKGSFSSTRCVSRGNIANCIAVGENFITGAPLLVQSIYHVKHWIVPTVANLPFNGAFYGIGAY